MYYKMHEHCSILRWLEINLRKMSNSAFARGAHTMNSMFFKPMIRKSYHKKSSGETFREAMKNHKKKVDAEEMKWKSYNGESTDANCWIPDERTGIFYPKGQEKVMESIPPRAGKDVNGVNWFSQNEDAFM